MDGIDESYIWQRRMAHGIRYQKGAVPFPESVDIGLEFNAALKRKEKLDQSLLTNGVMLEICQFAKTVTRSEKYFLFEMLEFNFDLGFDMNNDSLCYIYAVRVHNRIKHLKEQIKMKPNRWKETFHLPDPSVLARSKVEEVPGRYCPKWNKTADSSVLTVSSKNCQSSDNHEAETTRVASNKYTVKRQGGIRKTQGTNPFCAQLGVTLAVRPSQTPTQKLDPSLLTNGVMIEMLDFSRVLCGKHTYIVYELVKHNFGYAFNKPQFRMCLNRVIERKYTCLTAEDKDTFRKELFKVPAEKNKWEYKGKKRKTPDADDQELEAEILSSNKRQTRRQQANKMEELKEDDLSYMCPVEFETELQSGTEAEPENVKPESCLSGTEVEMNMLQDVKPEEEEVFISPVQPLNNGHKSSLSPTQTKEESLEPYRCLFSEGKCAETQKQRLWLRRAARAKQILTSSRVNDMFAHCREIGLDFNVCSGTKRSLDLQLLTNWVMWEVSKFGTALSRSVRSFLFEILLNNFTLALQDEQHERNFLVYMMAKHKNLVNHPKSQNMDFLCKPFNLPEIYHMVDVTSSFQQEVQSQGQEGLDSPDSAQSEEAEKEHPFCKKLGLNLWSTKERPSNQKLDLTVLTTGAVFEIFSFVKELCGEARNTVNDILEHNFHLDLQSGETEAAQMIQRWYTTQKNVMKKQNMSPKINRWLNMIVPLNGNLQQIPDSSTEDGELDLNKEELDGFCGFVKRFDYQNCKEIGLDLDLSSKSETKTKLDLQVLTRGVLFEVHQYVQQNYNRYVPALYEILEYNFDLSSQSHRKVEFAWSIASQVIAMTGKKCRRGDYLNKVFELPFEASKFPESSQVVFKEEREDDFGEPDLNDNDNDDIVFVRKLKPVDMEVEID